MAHIKMDHKKYDGGVLLDYSGFEKGWLDEFYAHCNEPVHVECQEFLE